MLCHCTAKLSSRFAVLFVLGPQSMDGIKALSDVIPEDELKRLEKQVLWHCGS